MMRTSATGNDGFSLVEVLVTLVIIGVCYISIAKGLIGNMKANRRFEEYSNCLLNAKRFFSDFNDIERKNVRISMENTDDGLMIHKIEFLDDKDCKVLDFKVYDFAPEK